MDIPKEIDDLLKNGMPTRTDLDTVWELSWKVLDVYKALKPIIDLLRDIEPHAQENKIEHIIFGEEELPPDKNKAVTISNDLQYFVNTVTKFQSYDEVQEVLPKKVSDLEDGADYAKKTYVDDAINALVDGAPAALDTLKELADKLADEGDAIAVLVNSLNQLRQRFGTLPNLYNASEWTTDGETKLGDCKFGMTGATNGNYSEIIIIDNDYNTYPAPTLLYIPTDATLDGETLVPVYDHSLVATSMSMKINPAHVATVEEALLYVSISAMEYTDGIASDLENILRTWANTTFVTAASQQYSKLILVANNGLQSETYTNYIKGTYFTVNANGYAFTIKIPATYSTPMVLMSGMEVPMTQGANETIDNVEYKVYTSTSTYSSSFKIQVV